MTVIESLLNELILIAIGCKQSLSRVPQKEEWEGICKEAAKQSLVGICSVALEKLPQKQYPDKDTLFYICGTSNVICNQNILLNTRCLEVQKKISKLSIRNCILKGQGIAKKYPDGLSLYRQAGDIDVWIEGGIKKALNLSKSIEYTPTVTKHHIDYPIFSDTEVEVHFTPVSLFNPFKNKRLYKWLDYQSDKELRLNHGDSFSTPSDFFNMIYLPLHIFHHLFDEGVGMRQLMDYYFFLLNNNLSLSEKKDGYNLLCDFGLKSFMGGVMWVLNKYFSLEEEFMLCQMNEKHGSFLLSEILKSGNMGKYDPRLMDGKHNTRWQRFVLLNKHNMRLLKYYPEEVLWGPYSRIKVWVWRKYNGWI